MSKQHGNRYSIKCCVPECNSKNKTNTNGDKTDLTFHRFPLDTDTMTVITKLGNKEVRSRRDVWIQSLNINKEVGQHTRVCSLHFKESDYFKG